MSNCTLYTLQSNETFFDAEVNEEGNLKLRSPREIFFLTNDFNYSYEGTTTVRGVEVDAWIAVQDNLQLGGANLSNATVEWFFTRGGWEVGTLIATTSEPIPWRLKLSGIFTYRNDTNDTIESRDFYEEYDIIGYSTLEHSFDAFDTSVCISPENYHILTMVVPSIETGVTDLGQFRRGIRNAISGYAKINPLQVGKIEVSCAVCACVIVYSCKLVSM